MGGWYTTPLPETINTVGIKLRYIVLHVWQLCQLEKGPLSISLESLYVCLDAGSHASECEQGFILVQTLYIDVVCHFTYSGVL